MERSNILVYGAGAIGTYIGGSLARTGQRIVFLEQPGALDELRRSGLRLDLQNAAGRIPQAWQAPFVVPPADFDCAASLQEALAFGPFDLAIFALKSFDTAAALAALKPFADKMPPFLCLSNGVENEPVLAAVLGVDRVIAGTVTSSVARRGISDIVLEKLRGIGVADGHPLSLYLWDALNAACLDARLYARPAEMKWSKMLTNLMVNASVAILDMPPQEVLAHPGLFRLEMAMLREALAVMRAQRLRVIDTPKTPVRLLVLAARLPAFLSRPLMIKAVGGGRGSKMPSFHIDLHAGRGRSEVEWLNGAVVRFGGKYRVRTPVNALLTETLLSLTNGRVALSEFSHQPEKLLALWAKK